MTGQDTDGLLRHASERAGERPEFLGYLFGVYCESHSLDRAGLASEMGTSEEMIARMSLCFRPGRNARNFGDDVDRIAERFSVDADKLTHVVRSAASIEELQNASSQGLLLAAREWEDDEP